MDEREIQDVANARDVLATHFSSVSPSWFYSGLTCISFHVCTLRNHFRPDLCAPLTLHGCGGRSPQHHSFQVHFELTTFLLLIHSDFVPHSLSRLELITTLIIQRD